MRRGRPRECSGGTGFSQREAAAQYLICFGRQGDALQPIADQCRSPGTIPVASGCPGDEATELESGIQGAWLLRCAPMGMDGRGRGRRGARAGCPLQREVCRSARPPMPLDCMEIQFPGGGRPARRAAAPVGTEGSDPGPATLEFTASHPHCKPPERFLQLNWRCSHVRDCLECIGPALR